MSRSKPSKNFSAKKSKPNSPRQILPQEAPRERKPSIANPHLLIYGTHAVQAALDNPNRILKTLYVTPQRQSEFEIYHTQLHIQTISKEMMDQLLPIHTVHQGVALSSILKTLKSQQDFTTKTTPIVILDQVTDPQNIGAILRSCAAFGVRDLIMQEKGAPEITGAMAKAAAGACEYVTLHKVTNLNRMIEELQQNGYLVFGADGHTETDLTTLKLPQKSVIIMGAEGTGMRKLVKHNCDQLFKIGINPEIESLNVSNALAISLYHYHSCQNR